MLDMEEKRLAKMRSDERILVLKVVDGARPKSTIGLLDPRLFEGGDNLRAMRDMQTSMWYLKYTNGILPQPLRQKFTSFNQLFEFATEYFRKRNLQIVEVLD